MMDRMNGIRHGLARGMDLIGDAVNVVLMLVVFAATWAFWLRTVDAFHAAGGRPWIPHTEEELRYAVNAIRMLAMDQQRRHVIFDFAANWLRVWVDLVVTGALALLFIAGLRSSWVRLRDYVAGV